MAVLSTVILLTGCQEEWENKNRDTANVSEETRTETASAELLKIAETYRDIYETAAADNTLGDLHVLQSIVDRLGENGYTAVDTENQNQVNMVHPESVEQFCEQVEAQQTGQVTFLSVMENGGLIRYDLDTAAGEVYVTRDVLQWEQNVPKVMDEDYYKAYGWTYSDGYLFFEKELPAGYDGAAGYTAVRVQPLDETCRKMNRQYILPVNYHSNDMFLKDWTEADFSVLDFYDLFDRLYPCAYGVPTPYEHAVEGSRYIVPAEEFEYVIESYFQIDQKTLRENTVYSEQGYDYRTRGFEDGASSPNVPYPEVVSYAEKGDGTITLTVNAVWPQMHQARAFSHETVIRPFYHGGFQYVSNHVLSSEDPLEAEWYTEKSQAY